MKSLFLVLMFLSTTVFAKDIVLTKTNTVSLYGPVTLDSVGEVMHELNSISKLSRASDPIYLILNTPGGSVMAGLDLIQYMNTLRRPVHVVANYAASMGFHILESSPIRYVTKYATLMSHRAAGGFQGEIPHQIQSRLKHVIDLVTKMDEQVISRTKGKYTLASYMELIRDEYYAVGENAITEGFADEIANLKCDSSLDGTVERNIQVFIFVAKVKFSKCPLITAPIVEKKEDEAKVRNWLSGYRRLEF